MTNLEQARIAFGNAYNATPEARGFILSREDEGKVVFAKNEAALKAYKRLKSKDVRSRGIRKVIFLTLFALALMGLFVYFFGFEDTKSRVILVAFFIGYLRFVIIHEIKHHKEREDLLKRMWRKQIVVYNSQKKCLEKL